MTSRRQVVAVGEKRRHCIAVYGGNAEKRLGSGGRVGASNFLSSGQRDPPLPRPSPTWPVRSGSAAVCQQTAATRDKFPPLPPSRYCCRARGSQRRHRGPPIAILTGEVCVCWCVCVWPPGRERRWWSRGLRSIPSRSPEALLSNIP